MATVYRKAELTHLLSQSGMAVLVWGSPVLGRDTTGLLLELVPELADAEPGQWSSERFPHLRHVVGLGEADWPRGVLGWDDALAGGRPVAPAEVSGRAAAVTPDDVALMLFTSGTTGAPKGAMLTHRGLVGHIGTWARHLELEPSDRTVMPSALFWGFGCMVNALVPLHAGSMIVLEERFDARQFLEDLTAYRCTHLQGVPSQYELLLKHPDSERYDLSQLRLIQIGGSASAETLAHRLLQRAPSATFISAYGITEASGVNTYTDLDDPLSDVMRTVGHAAEDNEIVIREPGGTPTLNPGEVGEMCIRGDSVMSGYFALPEETRRALQDGWLRTGDLAVMDERGYFAIVGRAVDAFKRGGVNVYPAEVEGVLTGRDDVQIAAVIGLPHEDLGECGAAFVVPAAGHRPDAEELIAHCRRELASYKVPDVVRIVDALPMTVSGKVQKFKLRDDWRGGS
jgi:fatty-acyl-CoA synthase